MSGKGHQRSVGSRLQVAIYIQVLKTRPSYCVQQPEAARYSMVEKEWLAIQWVVNSLHYYLLGCSFPPCRDHTLLQWLHHMTGGV